MCLGVTTCLPACLLPCDHQQSPAKSKKGTTTVNDLKADSHDECVTD
jgi:hypothetical protein